MKPRIVGLETEYGVMHQDEKGVMLEDEELDEKRYEILLATMPNQFLFNGGKIYLGSGHAKGHALNIGQAGHPEYCTPECLFPDGIIELLKQDKAGERILLKVLPWARLFKNSIDEFDVGPSDIMGGIFGTHENYSLHPHRGRNYRSGPVLETLLEPFFISRQIFTGSGRITPEGYRMHQKPYSQTRFILHDNAGFLRLEFRRSDSNMSETANLLKMGATSLVVNLYEDGCLPDIIIPSSLNVPTLFSRISSDISCKEKIPVLLNGKEKKLTLIEIQRYYWDDANKHYRGQHVNAGLVLNIWHETLNKLEEEPMQAREVDWVNKWLLLQEFMKYERLPLFHPFTISVAMQYHDIDPGEGLYYATQKQGLVPRLVNEKEIQRAMTEPPKTRAEFRANVLKKFPAHARLDWEFVKIKPHSCDSFSPRDFVIYNPFKTYQEELDNLESFLRGHGITPLES